ncbi:hypothetical protein [Streptomyces sp. NPDC001250]|uniref:hypothetical protein n=1 Tax=Streptomyces sp. NPDC001250 TaxID=3154382 RepID=UPI00331C79DA
MAVLNPHDAPAAVAAAAVPLEDLLADENHQIGVELSRVIAVAVVPRGRDAIERLAQAVLDAGIHRYRVTSATRLPSPRDWRDILRRELPEGALWPRPRVQRGRVVDHRTPDQNRQVGELADGIADLIESHLGPVRAAAELGTEHVQGPSLPGVWTRELLLINDEWATTLYLWVSD